MINTKTFISLEEVIWYMPGSVYWKNSDGVYQGCNENQVKALGLQTPSDIVGKKTADLLQDASLARTIEKIDSEVIRSGKELAIEEGPLDLNGKTTYYFTRKIPLHDSEGKVTGLLGISLDITQRKILEQQLLQAKDSAESANRAKTEFLANMSHDVKSPMTGIVTFTRLMTTDPAWRTPEKAEQVRASAEQVLSFFNSCLELSKLETSEFQSQEAPFSLLVLLEEIRALFVPRAQSKGLRFIVNYPSNLPKLFIGHRGSLYRVLLNLVGNALKFTDSGEVSVRVFIAENLGDCQIKIGIEVKDTGPGISEDKHEVIFEKLHRLTPSYEGKIEGSGIGLYIVDQYIKHMGGEIQVTSKLGQGSAFTVLLPITITSEGDTSKELSLKKNIPLPQKILSKSSALVLLVEDNPMIQIATKSFLEKAGFQVDVAGTGGAALELFLPEKYAFIFMDIGLPDLQGYEVASNIRRKELSNCKNVPIIALTAHGAIDVETFCSNAGMQGVLSKPITPEKIEGIWRRYGQREDINVPGLKLLDGSLSSVQDTIRQTEENLPIIDFSGTVELVGSKEQADQLFKLLEKELSPKYLDRLAEMIDKKNYAELRKDIHSLLGALCYAKAPRLNAALLELQDATRSMSATIYRNYENLKNEALQYKAELNSK